MKIRSNEITVREVYNGYSNKNEDGVTGYDNKLNIRPKYQREFVYKDQQRDSVIHTVMKDFPLNVMYWARNQDDTFEVMDGQQRTISICEFVNGNFSIEIDNGVIKYFDNLEEDQKEKILEYNLIVYFCEGTESEKLDWFRVINIAGEKLTEQELRNAVYTGTWLSDAKKYFSRTNSPAHAIASDYMSKVANRQEYLETALDWISKGNIEQYMAEHQHKPNAFELWNYFQSVITWASSLFGKKLRKEMKSVPWGELYDKYHKDDFSSERLEAEISQLMMDDEVTRKAGIYYYVFSHQDKYLSLRSFTANQKRECFEKQKGECPVCVSKQEKITTFAIDEMEADHITPWSQGGKTTLSNCKMLCKLHNRMKSDI